jgi:hypothetical protein
MKTRKTVHIQSIIDEFFPKLVAGEISLESVLEAHPEQADELRPNLETALWLNSQQPGVEPRPGYLEASKKRLMNSLRTAPFTFWQRLWQPHSPQRFALQAFSLSLLVVSLVLVIHTINLASRLALPGDWLYPAKLSIERLQLALTYDPQAQARLQIEHTHHRTTEIIQLVLENEVEYLPESVIRLETQIDLGLRDLENAQNDSAIEAQAMIEAMKTMLESEKFILTVLRDLEPAYAYSDLSKAIAATNAGLSALQY